MLVSYAAVKDRSGRNGREKRPCPCWGNMVGVPGVEPGTSSLSGTRSNQLSYTPVGGGGNGTRTRDIQLAKLALYQLSYAPGFRRGRAPLGFPRFAGRSGKASSNRPASVSVGSV